MERKGGCCLVPRHGAAAAAQHPQQMGRIMLKFRPIAPKPVAMAPAAPAPTTTTAVAVGSAGAAGRGKRKAVCAGGGRRGRKPKKAAARDVGDCRKAREKEKPSSSRSSSSSGMTSVDSSPPPGPQLATLPLMPVAPTVEDKAAAAAAAAEEPAEAPAPSQQAAWARPFAPLVTVEEVTATWSSAACVVGPGGAADDDAPAFVSDQWGRVAWRNAAFVRAAAAGGEAPVVVLGLGGALPAWGTCAGFTCRVRVRHSRVGSSSVVAPCDVWRLDDAGGYLWRLDLQAALTLGGGGRL